MSELTTESLREKKCVPCEGGVPAISPNEAIEYIKATPEWTLADDSKSISRKVNCKHFVEAIELLNRIADVAESQQHHPDLHLTGYRKVRIDLMTHAIGGLSENDFIVAAKIDEILG
jgi:4a-hydroxytetrahydrobiopterin dehydratase